jgi:iron(III) transport system ATP-binding protein
MSLKINHVTKRFDDFVAIDDISVEIREGEFIAILGPSGCGKTTLLRIIAGFIEPSSGVVKLGDKIFFDGQKTIPVENRNLGMVFQSFALWPHMNVREHIEFPLKNKHNRHLDKYLREEFINKALDSTGLRELSNRLPGELSGGQRQRVALARAIVSKPDILLMDEPLSSLDAELKITMRKEIQDIHKSIGTTIIYVTHDQNEALAMADRIIIMKDGRIEQIGTPEEVYKNPKTEFSASFVSKCNMLKGEWKNDVFYLNNGNTHLDRGNIDSYFVEKNIYPVRPEEFEIVSCDSNGNGIEGVITNKQYNGREIHYTVRVNEDEYNIYAQSATRMDIGERATLLVKKEKVS